MNGFATFDLVFDGWYNSVAILNVDLNCERHFLFKTVKGEPIIPLSRNDLVNYFLDDFRRLLKGNSRLILIKCIMEY